MHLELEPERDLIATERALRDLVRRSGVAWREPLSAEQIERITDTQEEDVRRRRPVVLPSPDLLDYVTFFDLVKILKKFSQKLLPFFVRTPAAIASDLSRLGNYRNVLMHGRQLLAHEQALVVGLCGLIQNEIVIKRSDADPANGYYPIALFAADSLGQSCDLTTNPATASADTDKGEAVVRAGDRITFTLRGCDPQDRPLTWTIEVGYGGTGVLDEATGEEVSLTWVIEPGHVREHQIVHVRASAVGAEYHRLTWCDITLNFHYRVLPPM